MKEINQELVKQELSDGVSITDIAQKLGVSRNTLYSRMRKWGVKKPPILNENFFESIDSEESGYWLGFIMADGSVGSYYGDSFRLDINLKQSDYKHLEKFHKCVNSMLEVRQLDKNSSCHSSHVSNKLCQDLMSLGCVPRKSLILKYPQIPSEIDKHFIRGYFDGDGCITFDVKKSNIRLAIIGTKEMLTSIQKRLGINVKLYQRSSRNTYHLPISGNVQVRRILDFLYKDSTIYLDRKYNKYKEYCN